MKRSEHKKAVKKLNHSSLSEDSLKKAYEKIRARRAAKMASRKA